MNESIFRLQPWDPNAQALAEKLIGQIHDVAPELDGFEVDCILSDPKISHVPLQQKRFEILRSDSTLFNEYRQLKEDCDGLPFREYEKRKKAFLEEKVFSSRTK